MRDNLYHVILRSEQAKDYVNACRLMKDYFLSKEDVPKKLKKIYTNAINNYRELLRLNNICMEVPRFSYDPKDKSTWKFLDTIISEIRGVRTYITMKKNPDWIYKNKI